MTLSKFIAQFISVISHPLLVLTYGLLLILAFNPFAFGVDRIAGKTPLILLCFAYTFLLPLISMIFMVLIGLIDSLKMAKREERIGPLIICIVFYTWFFINMKRNTEIPDIFTLFTMGSVVGLSISFFITVFSKISLHMVGLGGLVGIILVMFWNFGYRELVAFQWVLHSRFVLVLVLIFSGLVASIRIWLGSHNSKDIFGGFLVGVASQFIALRFLL